jgi:hypothetical protein
VSLQRKTFESFDEATAEARRLATTGVRGVSVSRGDQPGTWVLTAAVAENSSTSSQPPPEPDDRRVAGRGRTPVPNRRTRPRDNPPVILGPRSVDPKPSPPPKPAPRRSLPPRPSRRTDVKSGPTCLTCNLSIPRPRRQSHPDSRFCSDNCEDMFSTADNPSLDRCPRCGGELVVREPKTYDNWRPFVGCSNYPRCRFSAQ